jgi:cysteine synthase A
MVRAHNIRSMAGRAVASIVEAIGYSPMVQLSRMSAGLRGGVYAKLDYLNPGFSKKDRIARQIILDARDSNELRPGLSLCSLVCLVLSCHQASPSLS